jgi:hypothetical protein
MILLKTYGINLNQRRNYLLLLQKMWAEWRTLANPGRKEFACQQVIF